jgi:nucleoside-diphosphate-sugar epimerase
MTTIAITGATGVVGRSSVRHLLLAGHDVVGVTRSERGRRLLERLGARAVLADVFDRDELTAAFAGADAVVNVLTHIPAADRMTVPGAWDENDRLRTEASAAVARAADAAGAARLVQESVAFVYADGGEAWLDEDAPVAAASTTATSLIAEANAAAQFGGDAVALRFGLFVGAGSALTETDVEQARAGISPTLGRRDGYLPTLWLEDAAAAIAAALEAPAGVYNVADADPPTRAQIDSALAAAVGREVLRPAVEDVSPDRTPLARSQRVSTRRFAEATGWAPQVRGGTEGWRLIVGRALAA